MFRSSIALLVFSGVALGASHSTDIPAVHGMLFFGGQKLYVSHLPMYHAPHDYQAIAQVSIGPEAQAAYLADQKAHPGQKLYTLAPEKFVLPEKMQAGKKFHGVLFRGHFEKDGVAIEEVTVRLEKVILFQKLDPNATVPTTYQAIAFGSFGEVFLAHLIGGEPNFDQILPVSLKSSEMVELLEKQPYLSLSFKNQPGDKPLLDNAVVVGEMTNPALSDLIIVFPQIYLEFDDLL
jgi:hypothetical protein